MRAILNDPAQNQLLVSEVADPEPAEGELLVQVRAAGLNRADLISRAGNYRTGPAGAAPTTPFVAGAELSGEVVAVGPGVTGWAPGDRVMGRGAGYAELAVVRQTAAMAVPPELSWEEAGGSPVALFTMHDALITHGAMERGSSVLMHAATSGVGVVGTAMAAHLGASVVFAMSRSAEKLNVLEAFLGELPCPFVGIDTSAVADVPAMIKEHTGGKGVDVIVDNVGASVLDLNVQVAAITGRIVQVGRLGGRTADIDLDELARKRIELIGVTFRTRTPEEVTEIVRRCVEDVEPLLPLLKPRIDRIFPLAEAAAAQDALAENTHVGKLVLVP